MATTIWKALNKKGATLFILIKRDHTKLQTSITDLFMEGRTVCSFPSKINEDIRVIGKNLIKSSNLEGTIKDWKKVVKVLNGNEKQRLIKEIKESEKISAALKRIRYEKEIERYERIKKHLLK